MSHVSLLAADRPMPLYAAGEQRRRTVHTPAGDLQVLEHGFSVQEHSYYRFSVDELSLPMKPFQYELDLEDTGSGLRLLRRYLEENCSPGETIELWDLWVGGEVLKIHHFRGSLADFDLDTLKQLQEHTGKQQTCFTVEI